MKTNKRPGLCRAVCAMCTPANVMIFVTVILTVFAVSSFASSHSPNGIYLTKEDFVNNVVSFPSRSATDWLNVNHKKEVVISRNDVVIRFKHHEVFGFLADGHKHYAWGSRRKLFRNAGCYRVVDTAGLIILHTKIKHSKFSFNAYKYAKEIGGKRKVLTVGNLSKDFAHYPFFVEAVKAIDRNRKLHHVEAGITLVNEAYREHVLLANDKSERMADTKSQKKMSGRKIRERIIKRNTISGMETKNQLQL